jgi:hypothetical protein
MSLPGVWPQVLDFFGTPLVIEPSPGQLSGDAGLLPIRQFDERIGLTRDFAEALDDPRDPDLTEHSFLEMARSRAYGVPAAYAHQNDHDTFTPVADRSPERRMRRRRARPSPAAEEAGASSATRSGATGPPSRSARKAWPASSWDRESTG